VLFVRQWPRCPPPQILRNKYKAFPVAELAGNGLMRTGIAVIPIGIDLFPIDIRPFSIGTVLIPVGIVSIPIVNGVIPVYSGLIPIDFGAMQVAGEPLLVVFVTLKQSCLGI
jgi:hypothetical protein